jgi:hypothetical protein
VFLLIVFSRLIVSLLSKKLARRLECNLIILASLFRPSSPELQDVELPGEGGKSHLRFFFFFVTENPSLCREVAAILKGVATLFNTGGHQVFSQSLFWFFF